MMAFSRGGAIRGMTTGLVAAIIGGCCLLAAPAGARIVVNKASGQRFGIVPAASGPLSLTRARGPHSRIGLATPTCDPALDPQCASPMTSHGGPVQHGENEVLFFWDPNQFQSAPGYVTGMQTWLSSLAAGDYSTGNTASAVGNPVSVAQQYYDMSGPGATKNFIPNAIRALPYVMDTDPYPASGCTDSYENLQNQTVQSANCLTAGQLFAELNSYLKAHPTLPRGINTEYFLMTPPNVGTCISASACAFSDYCGWHTAAGSPTNLATQIVYADLPYSAGTQGCDVNGLSQPNLYTSGIDPVVGTFSHELAETMTDPDTNAWYGPGGGSDEIGDKCAYQFVVGASILTFTGLPTTGGGAYYNATLGGNNYLLQMEFDNQAGGCNQWDTDTQPVAAISPPATPASGVPGSFSLTGVTDPAGIAYVNWAFGDGTFGRSTATAAISHTYATGGSRTVTAIVTDNHGNELKDTAPVTVKQSPASVAVHLTNIHPAPSGAYSVKVTGMARPGGMLGTGHNRSQVDLFQQPGATCATSRSAEQSRAAAGHASRIAQWFPAPGSFTFAQARKAVAAQHVTVRFCGYVSRSAGVTDARAPVVSYTTT